MSEKQPIETQPGKQPENFTPRRRRLSKQGLAKFAEQAIRDKGPDILEAFAQSLLDGVKKGEKHSIEMVARMFYGDKGPGGVSIVQNTLNVNESTEQIGRARNMESIVRKIEERDSLRALPLPTPTRMISDGPTSIIDAEEVQ